MRRRSLTDPTRYVHQLLALVESWGVEPDAVLREAGIDPSLLSRAAGDRMNLEDVDRINTAARKLSGRGDIGFEFGLQLKPTSHGLLGYGLMGCSDVDDAWRLIERQQYHLTEAFSLNYQRSASGGRATFTPIIAMTPERLNFNLEVLAVSTHVTFQMLLGDRLQACDIRLSMAEPAHVSRYRALRPTRFHFSPGTSPGVVVTMDNELLATPLPMAEASMVAGVEAHLSSRVPATEARHSWTDVVIQLLCNVEGRQMTLKMVANQLGVSERTLDRRLALEGVRFGGLSEDLMVERACAMLGKSNMSVTQVAQRLGYSDGANFSRAFRRRLGVSPGDYQRSGGRLPDAATAQSLPM